MYAKILQKESLITLVSSGGEDKVAGGQRQEGDFSIYILLSLLNFELCEQVTYSNSKFKLFFKTQLALYTVTLISCQTIYLECRRHFSNQFFQAYQCDYQCCDKQVCLFCSFWGFFVQWGLFCFRKNWFILQCAFVGSSIFQEGCQTRSKYT